MGSPWKTYGEFLKCLIFLMVVPIEVPFISSPLVFDRLHVDVTFLFYDACVASY